MKKDRTSLLEKNILVVLANRRNRGLSMAELKNIINNPELLEKENKLFKFKIDKLSKEQSK